MADPLDRSGATRSRWTALQGAVPVVLPSLLLCDFGALADEVAKLESAGARALHLDIMDGHFVPNFTYGLPIVEAVRKATDLPLDAHLMIADPGKYIAAFRDAGADVITIHAEAVADPRPLLDRIRSLGAFAGLAINPPTPVSSIDAYLDACDLVLVMSVMPGFGGQSFDSVALEKLSALRQVVPEGVVLEVDGGVNASTIEACAAQGAQWFVAGSAIFSRGDYRSALAELSHAASGTRSTVCP